MHADDPRTVALRVLDWCFADSPTPGGDAAGVREQGGAQTTVLNAGDGSGHVAGLEPFQARAAARLARIIDSRGGAILADSVGLGKTHVALALIRAEASAGGSAVIVAPAQLRAHWERHLRKMPACRLLSHTALSRGTRAPRHVSLVVVDEAHAFRNPRTRRYAALALLCEQARVLLLTATPVNNSLFDFYHLVRLFAARDDFADVGVPDLMAAVDAAVHGASGSELRRASSTIMVRRTRSTIAGPSGSNPGTRFSLLTGFPARAPLEVIRYDLTTSCPDLLACLLRVLPGLTFPAHSIGIRAPAQLMQLGLLKRLESSTSAFRLSVRRHIRILEQFIAAAREGLLFEPSIASAGAAEVDGAVQLSLPAVALRPWPNGIDRDRLAAAAAADLHALRDLHRLITAAQTVDPKLSALIELLHDTDAKILLFTAYRDTAHAIWMALANTPRVALVTGSDARLGRARAGRRTIINRFAPLANGVRPPRITEDVRVLIATDVLAEGLNLQDASIAVSYDLPWNPVRLSQRFGRIDRLGSPHPRIRTVVFAPDRGVDDMLGLMKRLRRKLRQIRIVGGDAPWSLARSRSVRLVDDVESIDAERERALDAWTAAGPGPGTGSPSPAAPCPAGPGAARAGTSDIGTVHPHPPDPPLVGAALWPRDYDAALCCFAAGSDVLPVVVAENRPPEAGSAAAWAVLADLASGTCTPVAFEAGLLPGLVRRAWTAACHALLRDPDPCRPDAAVPRRRGHDAGAAVMRWLAARPAGATPADIEQADALLRMLRSGGTAGTAIRVARAIRELTRSDASAPGRRGMDHNSSCGGDRDGSNRPDGDSSRRDRHSSRSPDLRSGRMDPLSRPRGDRTGPLPIAVILLRANGRTGATAGPEILPMRRQPAAR